MANNKRHYEMKGTRLFQLKSDKAFQVLEFEVGFNPLLEPDLYRHSHAKILLFQQASGTHTIDDVQYELDNRQVHLVFPDQLHQLRADYCQGLIISVAFSAFQKVFHLPLMYFLKYQSDGSAQSLQPENFDHLYQLGWQLKNTVKEAPSSPMTKSYLDIILYQLSSNYGKLSSLHLPEQSIPYRFLELICHHLIEEHAVKYYAEELNISTRKLYDACMQAFSKSPSEIISDCLLRETQRLLVTGKYTMGAIAERLHFDSTSSFNRFVRKKANNTPSGLQQELRKIYVIQ